MLICCGFESSSASNLVGRGVALVGPIASTGVSLLNLHALEPCVLGGPTPAAADAAEYARVENGHIEPTHTVQITR